MFLRSRIRRKDGKRHRYWSIVENRRVRGNRIVQRQVLYLGEINDSQRVAWSRSIAVFADGEARPKQLAIFPDDGAAPVLDSEVVRVRFDGLQLRRPRQWGGCWLAFELWDQLQLDAFWSARLPPSRKGTRWLNVFKTLVVYRLLDPGSEWRLHRQWYEHSAVGDLLGEDVGLVQIDKEDFEERRRLAVPAGHAPENGHRRVRISPEQREDQDARRSRGCAPGHGLST